MLLEKNLQDIYHYRQDEGVAVNVYLKRFGAIVAHIPNMTDELTKHHFKTQLHTDQAEFFEFITHMNCRSMIVMIKMCNNFKRLDINKNYGRKTQVHSTLPKYRGMTKVKEELIQKEKV